MSTKQQLPQDVLNVPGQIISWFDDLGTGNQDYNFLSNFYEGDLLTLPGVLWDDVWMGGWSQPQNPKAIAEAFDIEFTTVGDLIKMLPVGPVYFKTGEAAFAAMKTWKVNPTQFIQMVQAADPNHAKSIGRRCDLREDWEVVKLDVMMAIQRAKYTLDRAEGKMLTDTGTALLIEGTFWGDDVWGVDLDRDEADATTSWGSNWLGTMLMARRAELIAESLYGLKTRAGEKNAKTSVDGWQKPAWMK